MNNENIVAPGTETTQAPAQVEPVVAQPSIVTGAGSKKRGSKLWIVLAIILAVIAAGFVVCFYIMWRSNNYEPEVDDADSSAVIDESEEDVWLTAETGILGLKFDHPETWTAVDTTNETSGMNSEGDRVEIKSWGVKSPNGTILQLTDVSMGEVGGPYYCDDEIDEGYFKQSFHKEASASLPGYNVVSSLQEDGFMSLRLSALTDVVLDKGEIDLCQPQYENSNWGQDYFRIVEVNGGAVVFSNFSPASENIGATSGIDERDLADAVKILASLRQ